MCVLLLSLVPRTCTRYNCSTSSNYSILLRVCAPTLRRATHQSTHHSPLTTAHRIPHTAHRTPHTAHSTPYTAHRNPESKMRQATNPSIPCVLSVSSSLIEDESTKLRTVVIHCPSCRRRETPKRTSFVDTFSGFLSFLCVTTGSSSFRFCSLTAKRHIRDETF